MEKTSILFKFIKIYLNNQKKYFKMPKNNFLLVDLNESKTKQLAETITSETSRKILNHLTEKEDSEANISKELNLPISTVHYHLQKLQEAGLVVVEEFHYSQKGREVNHYKLANKYIIIAPRKVSGLREKLRGILPVAVICAGIAGIIRLAQSFTLNEFAAMNSEPLLQSAKMAADEVVAESASNLAAEVLPRAAAPVVSSTPDIALWFLIGSLATILIYLIVAIIREQMKKK